jgi:hypothetical protein
MSHNSRERQSRIILSQTNNNSKEHQSRIINNQTNNKEHQSRIVLSKEKEVHSKTITILILIKMMMMVMVIRRAILMHKTSNNKGFKFPRCRSFKPYRWGSTTMPTWVLFYFKGSKLSDKKGRNRIILNKKTSKPCQVFGRVLARAWPRWQKMKLSFRITFYYPKYLSIIYFFEWNKLVLISF